MKALSLGPLTAGDLANRINLSQGTVTDILKRLEVRGLITRLKDVSDKRRVIVSLSEQGQEIINKSSDQLQAPFAVRLSELPEWEQSQLLAALQRIAFMMEGSNQARVVLNLPDQEDKVVMNSSPVGEFPSDDL